jgi:hypothetical protein
VKSSGAAAVVVAGVENARVPKVWMSIRYTYVRLRKNV